MHAKCSAVSLAVGLHLSVFLKLFNFWVLKFFISFRQSRAAAGDYTFSRIEDTDIKFSSCRSAVLGREACWSIRELLHTFLAMVQSFQTLIKPVNQRCTAWNQQMGPKAKAKSVAQQREDAEVFLIDSTGPQTLR